jgi:peptidoglycan/xylan/chitin deacetylase (PgdA/CDA1 family)
MRKVYALILALITTIGISQDSLKVEISNWKDAKQAAIVFTFDDWSPGHGEIVVPMFIKHKVPATFYVTTKNKDLGGSWEKMKLAYKHGCEIGNHTETHPNLAEVDSVKLYKEVTEAQDILRKNVHPKVANTFAFPYGAFNSDVLGIVKKDHIGARLAGLRYGRAWPYSLTYGKTDYFQLQTFMARDIHTPSTIKRIAKQAIEQGGMVTFMYHSIFNDTVKDSWFGPIHETMLEAHLKSIKSLKKDVWITTFEKAIQYHKEKANTMISFKKDSNEIIIDLKCTLDERKFQEPITISISGFRKDQIKAVFLQEELDETVGYVYEKQQKLLLINCLPYNSKLKVQLKH